MTRLADYLRAERPDETEPASFYVPGAADWRSARKGQRKLAEETPDAQLDTDDTEREDIAEIAAARAAAALNQGED